MIQLMFSSRHFRKHQRRHGIVTLASWLLMMLLNCGVMAASVPASGAGVDTAHHMSMQEPAASDCCASVELDCCEPASQVLPTKYSDADDGTPPLSAVLTASSALVGDFKSCSAVASPDWRLRSSSARLHLLHCRILV
jgi:hypothetical protein